MDVITLLKFPESKTLEFKRDLSSHRNILKTLVAFANTAGGTLIVGVEDKNKTIFGITEPLAAEEKLANIISDGIIPKLIPNIEIIPFHKTYLLKVEVFPSTTRPHYLKKEGEIQGTFIRVGASNRLADDAIRTELTRFSLDESFDERAIPELNSEALDFRAASEFFSPICKLTKTHLETLGVLKKYQRHLVPSIGGYILFGTARTKYFPDAWIQVGRFVGIDKRHARDARDIETYPISAIHETMEFVKKHAMRTLTIKGIQHTVEWDIPLLAVREALINAVVHADYAQKGSPIRLGIFDDRIEIENPGLLSCGLTIEDIKRGVSKLRNRVIGRVFHKLGLIERWGSGIRYIIDTCRDAKLKDPVFEEIGFCFRVTISLEKAEKITVDKINAKILSLLNTAEAGLPTKAIAEHIQLSERATRARMIALIKQQKVIEVGSSPKDPRRKYFAR